MNPLRHNYENRKAELYELPIPYFKSYKKREAYINRLNQLKAKRMREIGLKDPKNDYMLRRINGKLKSLL